MKRTVLLVICMFLLLQGCLPANQTPAATQPSLLLPTATQRAIPIETPLPPTVTTTPTLAPTPTPSFNPMDIRALRARDYPGSDIVIVRELDPGENYHRYYAYYLSDGLKIYALLTVPNGDVPEGGWPAIVFNHGYIPPDVYRTTERYIAYVDWLARSGFIVFRIDYRGNDQSEGEAKGAYGDPGYTIDVLNAVASIKKFPQADPDKIGMWGHSMGGFLTLRAMVISKDIKAGVIWAGVVAPYYDLLYNWHRTGSFESSPSSRGVGWRTQWLDLYGTPEKNPDFWNNISANNFLADLSGPLQLHHGSGDEDVPIDFSINLAVAVRKVGVTAELYTYDGDNHNIANYFTMAMNRTIEFFKEHLK
jgi:uncharacterized protein